jgi:HAMP domain-containing protein
MEKSGRQMGTALAGWARRRLWWVLTGLAVAIVLGIAFVLSIDVARQTQDLVREASEIPEGQISAKDRVDLVRTAFQYQADNFTRIWTGIIGSFSGVAAVAAGAIAWRNLRATQAKLDVDREGQLTDRFTKAIDQLASERTDAGGKPIPNLEVRLGGIYALESIARDSPADHWTIMEVLTAYVRENARWIEPSPAHRIVSSLEDAPVQEPQAPEELPPLRTDIQAVLSVVGRRMRSADRREREGLNLKKTDLRKAYLNDAHLERAFLEGAHLEEAFLADDFLAETSRPGAHLENAYLVGANFGKALLRNAHLDGAYLNGAHLERARCLSQEQVYSAYEHGEGALLPPNWPANWRDRFHKAAEQPPVAPSVP